MDFQEQQLQMAYDYVLAEYHSCYLCGQELAFSYKMNEETVTEQSACSHCGFKNKPQKFTLH